MTGRLIAERLIYGKLAGQDREHMVVAHSSGWPDKCGVPRSIGSPQGAGFRGGCALDWYQAPSRLLLALSWCEPGPRTGGRDFYQVQYLVALPEMMAPALPHLPALVRELRTIPMLAETNWELPLLAFAYDDNETVDSSTKNWLCHHWFRIAAVLSALLAGRSVSIHGCTDMEDQIRILGALMWVLPPHLRVHLTFSTAEFAPRPYWRRVTFSPRHRASHALDWQRCTQTPTEPIPLHPVVAKWGDVLHRDGMAALRAETLQTDDCGLFFS